VPRYGGAPQLTREALGGRPAAVTTNPIEDKDMRRYEQVSGALFCLIAALQLTRFLLHWPVQVADVAVPLWASLLACFVASAFAIWAFRARGTA
jgi:hypothetical protein